MTILPILIFQRSFEENVLHKTLICLKIEFIANPVWKKYLQEKRCDVRLIFRFEFRDSSWGPIDFSAVFLSFFSFSKQIIKGWDSFKMFSKKINKKKILIPYKKKNSIKVSQRKVQVINIQTEILNIIYAWVVPVKKVWYIYIWTDVTYSDLSKCLLWIVSTIHPCFSHPWLVCE